MPLLAVIVMVKPAVVALPSHPRPHCYHCTCKTLVGHPLHHQPHGLLATLSPEPLPVPLDSDNGMNYSLAIVVDVPPPPPLSPLIPLIVAD